MAPSIVPYMSRAMSAIHVQQTSGMTTISVAATTRSRFNADSSSVRPSDARLGIRECYRNCGGEVGTSNVFGMPPVGSRYILPVPCHMAMTAPVGSLKIVNLPKSATGMFSMIIVAPSSFACFVDAARSSTAT